ncbi:MAG: Zn-dependent oligopeptidase, partial [Elusimicrobia bacterium]|nr:Zn-dependent oligopeptidase [Elusimicrobiota bacterium]
MRALIIAAALALCAVRLDAAVLPAAPPTGPLDFGVTAERAARICARAKARAEERLQGLSAAAQPSFASAFVPFSDILADLQDETAAPMFLGQVAMDKGVRDAGLACDTDISKYLVEVFSREDLFNVLKAAAERGEILPPEEARLVEKTLLDFKRSGLALPKADRETLKAMRQRIVELSNDFTKEVSETKDYALFTEAQVAGLPADLLKRLPKEDGKHKVSLDYPDYFPFMENAKDPEARRILQTKFDSRGGEANKARLAEILKLRDSAAKFLGYRNHAEYVLEERMAMDPDTVLKFLSGLREKLYRKGRPELRALLALKKQELGARSDGVLRAWDWRYYHNRLMKQRYQVDKERIKAYFPTDLVVDQMLRVYQEVLGLQFSELSPAQAWHPDVKQFEISDSRTGVKLAQFYMDLYPREGKYKHAAAFTLLQGRELPDGSYQKPISAIVANFDKPTAEKPSTIPHSEVETLFHEFGHIMHQTLTRARYQRFSGTAVARDFVESPSQMFQNWVWKGEVLDRISGHYQDRAQKLPRPLIAKLLAAKNADSGLVYLRQNFFATYDMSLHTAAELPDTTALYGRLMKEISLIPMSAHTIPEAGFTHLMGYDAGYYSYLWSEVYALDGFSRFVKEGLLSEKVGREYRREVLERGSARDEGVSLRAFLGREPGDEAFLKNIGLDLKPAKK